MTTDEARTEAQKLFGPNAEAWERDPPPGQGTAFPLCCIGFREGVMHTIKGYGESWEKAIERARAA